MSFPSFVGWMSFADVRHAVDGPMEKANENLLTRSGHCFALGACLFAGTGTKPVGPRAKDALAGRRREESEDRSGIQVRDRKDP
jgi:hypothetical protein